MKKPFIFEIDEELKEKLKKLAKENHVSMANYLRTLIRKVSWHQEKKL